MFKFYEGQQLRDKGGRLFQVIAVGVKIVKGQVLEGVNKGKHASFRKATGTYAFPPIRRWHTDLILEDVTPLPDELFG